MGFVSFKRRSRTVSLRRGVTAWHVTAGGGRGRHAAAFGEDDSSPLPGYGSGTLDGASRILPCGVLDAQPKLEYVVAMAKNAV